MAEPELVVLGSGGDAPTRTRAVSSYLLRAPAGALLLDPGEGTLRQLVLMGLGACRIERVFVSHFHLDHCLGLPAVLEHLQVGRDGRTVEILFPAAGAERLGHLLALAGLAGAAAARLRPLADGDAQELGGGERLRVRALAHEAGVPTLGLRWEGADGRALAFVPDTAPCDAALDLARGATLLLCQASDLDHRADAVRRRGLMTAREAAALAAAAGVGRLLLGHFQPRHEEPNAFLHEAGAVFRASDVARDLTAYRLGRAPAAGAA